MLTEQQINQFRVKAKAAGYDDATINAEIERKRKELSTSTPPATNKVTTTPQPTVTPQPTATTDSGVDLSNPDFSTTQTQQPKKNLFDKATDFLFSRTKSVLKKAIGTVATKGNVDTAAKSAEELQKSSYELAKKAQKETDPTKKALYLKQSKELSQRASGGLEEAIGGFEQATGMDTKKTEATPTTAVEKIKAYAPESIGMAGEIGSFFLPAGKITKGAKLGKKILQGAKAGAEIGAIQGFTDPNIELNEVGKRFKTALVDAGFGAITGGLLTSAYELPKTIIKKSLKNAPNIIRGVFKVTPSEMRKFRKVNGMDFGEEILSRDGQSIAGKTYEEIAEHMTTQKDKAQKVVADALIDSKATIPTSDIIKVIDEKIASLAPEKGNVNTEGAIATLNAIKETLAKNPENLNMTVANNIKRQMQEAGSAAFSPTGKGTPTSEAFANISRVLRKKIEEKEPLVKEGNRLIQLYTLANDSITKQGDAAVNRVAAGNLQKFIQNIPTVAGFGLGYGFGGIPGGAAGLIGGNLISGLQGTIRNKFLSPEFQTAMAATIQNQLKTIANPTTQQIEKITSQVAQEGIKQLIRSNTSGIAPTVEGDQPINTNQGGELNKNNGNANGNQNAHINSINQTGVDINQPEFSTTQPEVKTEKTDTITGHTVAQHMAALSKATARNDKAAIKQISAQLKIEQDYQKTVTTKLSATEQAKVNEAEGGLKLVDTVEKNFSELQKMGLTAKTGGLGRLAGLKGKVASVTQEGSSGAAAAAYSDTVQAFLSKLARAGGEKGVLTDQDIARIGKAMPKFTDTPETSSRKLENVRLIIRGAIKAKQEAPIGVDETSLGGFSTTTE